MFLNAWDPGYTPQFAGWRVLPHFYAPVSWHLPFRLGLVSEFSFQNDRYEENTRRVELRPILDREFPHWQVVLIQYLSERCTVPEHGAVGTFEPAMLLRWKREKSHHPLNTTGRWKASPFVLALSLKFIRCSSGAIGRLVRDLW